MLSHPFAVRLLALFIAFPAFAGNVREVDGDYLTVKRDKKRQWEHGDQLCVYRKNKRVGCGEITGSSKHNIRLHLPNWDMPPQVGDTARPRKREFASLVSGDTARIKGRDKNDLGFYFSLLGDPFPTIIGMNLGYNVFSFLRVTAGYGSISFDVSNGNASGSGSITTVGLGTRAMVPGWKLSPAVGLGFSSVTAEGTIGSSGVGSDFAQSGSHLYGSVSLDYQATGGFHWAVGWNQPFKSGADGLPYVSLGYFFDVL